MSDSLPPHESQHARPPCPSQTPGVYSNSCPSSRWCHPAISSSVIPFSSCPQSLLASGSFPMSQLFASGGQRTGVSASASVLPMNTQDLSPSGWTGLISLQSKGLSRAFSNTTVRKHQFLSAQLSSRSNSHIHTWPLENHSLDQTDKSLGSIKVPSMWVSNVRHHYSSLSWDFPITSLSRAPELIIPGSDLFTYLRFLPFLISTSPSHLKPYSSSPLRTSDFGINDLLPLCSRKEKTVKVFCSFPEP